MSCSGLISIGNDIVDLRRPEPALHSRFIERVFAPSEREVVEPSIVMLWLFWAAKEAAYKAAKRLKPETIFSPSLFVFDYQSRTVTHQGERYRCDCQITDSFVHVVATTMAVRTEEIELYQGVDIAKDPDLSVAARSFAVRELSSLMKMPEEKLAISSSKKGRTDKIPVLFLAGQESEALLSLSHHGRFVAFCCLFGTPKN